MCLGCKAWEEPGVARKRPPRQRRKNSTQHGIMQNPEKAIRRGRNPIEDSQMPDVNDSILEMSRRAYGIRYGHLFLILAGLPGMGARFRCYGGDPRWGELDPRLPSARRPERKPTAPMFTSLSIAAGKSRTLPAVG